MAKNERKGGGEGGGGEEERGGEGEKGESFPKNLVPLQAFNSSLQLTI